MGAYYAASNNRFWQVLAEVGLTPRELAPEEYPLLPQYGMGLTDIAKSQAGMDHTVTHEATDATQLREKVQRYQPRVLAFTSKEAARRFLGRKDVEYGRQKERVGETILWVLPSTSGAARRWWKIEPWRDLARWLTEPE